MHCGLYVKVANCYFKMDAPRALVFRPLVKGNEALGKRLLAQRKIVLAQRKNRMCSLCSQQVIVFSAVYRLSFIVDRSQGLRCFQVSCGICYDYYYSRKHSSRS